ncbi:MAG TPA: L,D-transpeptidase [Beijerinckiaceae bacterium]|jgi:lipoprotein-anchoring transpeptidase ErfK/SrfK
MRIWLIPLAAALLGAAAPARAAPLDLKSVNEAQFSERRGKGIDPAILKAQVLLDRARFSPGVIDGRGGDNFDNAVAAFAEAQGLRDDGLTREVFDKLATTSSDPVLQEYTIADADVKGPFVKKIPSKMEEMAKLDRLAYRSALEGLAEKFHMDEGLLRALNPKKDFEEAGTTIIVAAVRNDKPDRKVGKIVVHKSEHALRALDKEGKLVAFYPASIGSEEKPAPTGTHTVERVAPNPTYTYNPKYKFKGVKSDKPFTIKAGPNNPVGAVWIDLSLESYGIHGTPEPSKVGKTYSHGCVRLTNWDVRQLAQMIEKGTPVEFVD